MSDHKSGSGERSLSRRGFLGTSAKVGAGVALAGAGLDLAPRKADAAGITLTYMGLGNPTEFPHGQQDAVAQFNKAHPGITAKYIAAPPGEANIYHDKLVTVLSAHDGSIDVFDSDVIWQAQWAPAGWVTPLDKVFPPEQQKNYAPGMIWADTIGNHIYGIPWLFDVGHLFYRKDILAKEGLKPATTWQELHDQGVMLKKKYPNMVPFVACYQAGQQLICNFMEYSWSAGGDFLDPKTGAVVFNSPANLQALETMISYIKDKVVQPGIVTMELDTGRQIFTNGNAIYHRNWNYAYAASQANPKLVGKVDSVLTPHYPGHRSYVCAGGWQYVVNAYSNHLNEAIELATFLGSAKMQVYKTLHGGWSPAYLPANYDPQVVKTYPGFPTLADHAKYERSRPKSPFWTAMSTVAEQELTNALIGKKKPQQALKDAQGKIEAILAGA
ncbi:MAG TPA: ABC transporter substrate-binding protein [Chloroflexota bacterium]|nr:ABC transporter substrate-binding protein [Chloroflexota bacterium]